MRQVAAGAVGGAAEEGERAQRGAQEQPAPVAPAPAHLPAAIPPEDAQRLGIRGTRRVERAPGGARALHVQTTTSVLRVMPDFLLTSSRILSVSARTSRWVAPP